MKGDRATALVCRDGKLMMIHRLRAGMEYYVLPGGHVEDGETVEIAVIRELKEETSLDAKLGSKLYSFADKEGRNHHIYSCDYVSGLPKLPPDSIESTRANEGSHNPLWVDIDEIKGLTIWPTGTRSFLLDYFNKS